MHITEKRRHTNSSPIFESRSLDFLGLYPLRALISLDSSLNSSIIAVIIDKGD